MASNEASCESRVRDNVRFWRRVAVIFYDSLALLSLMFLATAALLPLTDGYAIPPGQLWYVAYLLGVSFLYLGWFWTHGGQTLGMRAWRVRVVAADAEPLGWRQAARRFAAACLSLAAFGIGFLWAALDPDRLAWHDRLSHTKLVVDAPEGETVARA